MIKTGALPGAAPRRGLVVLRSAVIALVSTALLALAALPANAAGRSAASPEPAPGFDILVGGFAALVIVGFAGAVLWYVARNHHSGN